MNSLRALAIVAAAAALSACSGSDDEDAGGRTPYEELYVTADTSAGYQSDSTAPVVAVQGGATETGPLTATGNLQGVAENAPPGSVTIKEEANGTRILIAIHRYTPGTELQASIATGTCARPGEVVATVPEVIRIGSEGVATLNTIIQMPTEQVLNGKHTVRVTNPQVQGAPQVVLACADLPLAAQ